MKCEDKILNVLSDMVSLIPLTSHAPLFRSYRMMLGELGIVSENPSKCNSGLFINSRRIGGAIPEGSAEYTAWPSSDTGY